MEGHRVVRLDVVCYIIVGLGVSGFAWFGSVGLARLVQAECGRAGLGSVRHGRQGEVWRGTVCWGAVRQGAAGLACCVSAWQVTVWSGRHGGSWQVRVRHGLVGFGMAVGASLGEVRFGLLRSGWDRRGRLKPERRKSEVGRHKQKAILIRHQQVQSVC